MERHSLLFFCLNEKGCVVADTALALLSLSLVPRPGVEPGRVAPLVFETSASTDSAIWALKASAKIRRKVETAKD